MCLAYLILPLLSIGEGMINSAWIDERIMHMKAHLRYPDGVEVELAKRMSFEELANLVQFPHIRQTHEKLPLNFLCILLK